MIGRAAEVLFTKTAQGSKLFTDVHDWAAQYVGYAADNGITQGAGNGLSTQTAICRISTRRCSLTARSTFGSDYIPADLADMIRRIQRNRRVEG